MGIIQTLLGRSPVVAQALESSTEQRFAVDIPARFFGLESYEDPIAPAPRINRQAAISVPAVKRCRDLIAGSIGQLPLDVYDAERVQLVNDLLPQPERNRGRTITMTRTVEDLVFEGIAWWLVVERAWDGYPRFVRRIDPWRVDVDEARGIVRIDGKIVPDADLIRFDSPNDPLLVAGARAIRTCLKLDATAAQYADDPQAREYFVPADGAEEVDDDEVLEIMREWRDARKKRSVGYVPASLRLEQGNLISPRDLQLADARQHAVLEIARVAGVDPEELGVSTTSRTYANQFDRRKAFLDFNLGPYMRAIEDRLSLGDVTKRGNYVRFNLDAFLRSDTASRWGSYEIGLRVGAITKPEIRELEDKPALPEDQMPQTQPARASQFSAADDDDRVPAIVFEAADFAVDLEQRTLTGVLLPFGEVSRPARNPNTGKSARFSFAEGTVMLPDDPTDVVLNYAHDKESLFMQVGAASELALQPIGVVAKFNIAETPEGDRVLALAAAKVRVLKSFSAEVEGEFAPDKDGVMHAKAAILTGAAVVRKPAFAGAHITSVAASAVADSKEGTTMTETQVNTPAEGSATDSAQAPTFSAEQHAALLALLGTGGTAGPEVISASEGGAQFSVKEELPYRFDRGGNFLPTEHVFSADLHEMARARDSYGNETEAGRRVMALVQAAFAVGSSDVNELNPAIQRPDMFVDQRDYRTPLWNFVNKGAPPNGVQPFTFPKFSSASGLVGDHTEGVEPTSGTYVTTSQTITPTGLSGKASIPREVWDMGGNPAVSTLIFNQMQRGWREGLESATATFLNTLTAATDITLAAGTADDVLAGAWDAALADLQFVRGYDFEALALEKELYKKFVAAVDGDGRKLYPQINATNANGGASRRFISLDLGGVTGVPSWALPSTAGSPNNSWLFDPSTVHGWASQPQRLEFPGTAAATTEDPVGSYAPVAMVDLAIFGYKAFANSDLGGVRQVIYDTTV